MEALHKKAKDIQSKLEEIENKKFELMNELCRTEKEIREAEVLLDISNVIPKYEKKLERLKNYMESNTNSYGKVVSYAFKKNRDSYTIEGELIQDPLDYKLVEFNPSSTNDHIEIVFHYYNELVKEFVKKWFDKNISYASYCCYKENKRKLYWFYNDHD